MSDRLEQRTTHRYRTLYENFGALPKPVNTVKLIGLSKWHALTPARTSIWAIKLLLSTPKLEPDADEFPVTTWGHWWT